ncbi:MAG: sigma-70 family RNA polymerase sigma factor [Planctomycetes bacterium]|nr:sigma-70 family RNA polymerase sigma factor [Planctomycetota bacterium]
MQHDSELIRLAGEGNREAYGELAKRYERLALVVSFGILSDRHLAEDAVQEALVSAYRRLDSLRDSSKFGLWLMQITRREAIRLAKRHKRFHSLAGSQEPVDEKRPDAALNGHDHAISWINRLPAQERVVFSLHHLDGRAAREIAELTGRPIGTVTKQLSRAMQRLRCWAAKEDSD